MLSVAMRSGSSTTRQQQLPVRVAAMFRAGRMQANCEPWLIFVDRARWPNEFSAAEFSLPVIFVVTLDSVIRDDKDDGQGCEQADERDFESETADGVAVGGDREQ